MNPLQNWTFGMVWFHRIDELIVDLLTGERNKAVDLFNFSHEAFGTQKVNAATDAFEVFDTVANKSFTNAKNQHDQGGRQDWTYFSWLWKSVPDQISAKSTNISIIHALKF